MKKSQTTVFAIVITLITVSVMCLAWEERAVHASRNSKMAPIAFNEASLSPVTSPKLTWTFEQELDLGAAIGPDNPSVSVSVAVSGNTAVIGVYGHNLVNGGSRVLVFVRSDVNGTPTWTLDSTLYPDFQPYETWFGYSVAISGDTIVIGAPLDQAESELIKDAKGAAYVFKRNSSWTKQQKLVAADGDYGDFFGASVAISGDKVLVGAAGDTIFFHEKQGSAYLFRDVGTTWIQQWKLFDTNGSAGDDFGRSVALSESKSTVAVGAEHSGPTDTGAVSIFFVSDDTWTHTQKLTGSVPGTKAFGLSVSLSRNVLVVGGANDQAYIFTRHGPFWLEHQQLTASESVALSFFGISVAISGDTLVVGGPIGDPAYMTPGRAFVFEKQGQFWTETAKLVEPDEGSYFFGARVAVDDQTIVVSAHWAGKVLVYSGE